MATLTPTKADGATTPSRRRSLYVEPDRGR